MRILRTDCPWDREQTHQSIAHLLIEEAYEVKESIEDRRDDELKKELGDILLHVVMHSVIAEERSAFTIDDVIELVGKKLVHRHPHVFGEVDAEDSRTVARNWEQLKMKEGRDSIFEGMPKALPALQRSERVQEKAAKVGFDWPDRAEVWQKVLEEVDEFRDEAETVMDRRQNGSESETDFRRMQEEFGDLLFSLVNIARFLGIRPEEALQKTTNKFISRFQHVERRLREQGKELRDSNLEEMDGFWEEAKQTASDEAE